MRLGRLNQPSTCKLSLFFIKCKFPPNSEWLSATHNSLVKLRQSTGMMSPAKFPRTFAPKVFRSARLMLLHDSLRARGNGSHFPGDYKASRREGDEPASERAAEENWAFNCKQCPIANCGHCATAQRELRRAERIMHCRLCGGQTIRRLLKCSHSHSRRQTVIDRKENCDWNVFFWLCFYGQTLFGVPLVAIFNYYKSLKLFTVFVVIDDKSYFYDDIDMSEKEAR